MKVNKSLNKMPNILEISAKDERKAASSTKSGFNSHLKKMSGDTQDEKLRELAKTIVEQGERFSKKIDLSELKAYKRMIAEFMDEAVKTSSKFSKESFLDRRGRHRVYATIKNVNKELDELTKEVLKSERDNIKVLQSVEDIRGMILDIIL